LVAPLHADLTGLPPAFVAIAACDILADCNHAFAARLADAGVTVHSVTYPGATHSFLEAIERLVKAMEGDNWSTDRLGPRYAPMLQHIIAFRAHVRTADPLFKLGQDESASGFAEIVARHPDRMLAAWMEGQR